MLLATLHVGILKMVNYSIQPIGRTLHRSPARRLFWLDLASPIVARLAPTASLASHTCPWDPPHSYFLHRSLSSPSSRVHTCFPFLLHASSSHRLHVLGPRVATTHFLHQRPPQGSYMACRMPPLLLRAATLLLLLAKEPRRR